MSGRFSRLYRLTLRSFPDRFRDEYADELLETVAEKETTVRSRGGRVRLVTFWTRELAAAFRIARRMRRMEKRQVKNQRGYASHTGSEGPNRRWGLIESTLQGLRFAVRSVRRSPMFSAFVTLTFGIGIGLSLLVFSLFNGALFKGLPFDDPHRIVSLGRVDPSNEVRFGAVSAHDYNDWARMQTSFEGLGAWGMGTINLGFPEGRPQRVAGGSLSPGLLAVLRVQPLLGRTFAEEEASGDGQPVILIGHDLWQERFEGDPDVIGRTIRANGVVRTIIGVMPSGFYFPFLEHAWLPLNTDPGTTPRGRGPWYNVIGRLRQGVSLDEAREEMATIASYVARTQSDTDEGISATVRPYTSINDDDAIPLIVAMFGAVLAITLIGCINVANLLIARGTVRAREMAVRTALGAGRVRIIGQLVAEVLVLALPGGALGFVFGTIGIQALAAGFQGTGMPFWVRFEPDHRVFLFTVGVTLLTGLVSGVMPALRATKTDVGDTLKDEGRGSSGSRVTRITGGLVIAELALSCAVLVAAGLMIRSASQVRRVDLPFTPQGVLTARIDLPPLDYPGPEDRGRFHDELLARLEALPGVESVALSDGLPGMRIGRRVRYEVEGQTYAEVEDYPIARRGTVTPGYFRTFRIGILQGRDFRPSDRMDSPAVCIISETMARLVFQGDALGKRIRIGAGLDSEPWWTVIGVAPDMWMGGIGSVPDNQPGFFVPAFQRRIGNSARIAVRTQGPPASRTGDVRDAVESIDPDLPIYEVASMEDALHNLTWAFRVFGILFLVFGVSALFLAAVGLYGVMSFAVSQRTRELGVRLALGARGGQLMGLVMRRVAIQLLVGLALGLAIAALITPPLAVTLFEVDSRDPVVFCAVTFTLAASGFLASFVPARRVTRVDPISALTPE